MRRVDLLETAFSSLIEPARILDHQLRVVLSNPSAHQVLNRSGEAGIPLSCQPDSEGVVVGCEKCLIRQVFEDGQEHSHEMQGIDSNGDRWVIEVIARPLHFQRGKPEYVLEIFRDRSREKRLGRLLVQSSKLVAIGEMAAGIAHEIRNPLAGIRLGLNALEPLVENPAGYEILEDINRDITRLDQVVSNLLDYTRNRPQQMETFPLAPLFDDVCRYIRNTAEKQKVIIRTQVEPENLEIHGDRNQIHQVLLNLLLNALQAMPEGGTLTLMGKWSEDVNWSRERSSRSGFRIMVIDTGCGIPDEDMQRLFDPFFTTKPNGTGLGLTTSLSLVRKHNGELRINSTPGQGTTAQILLPEGGLED